MAFRDIMSIFFRDDDSFHAGLTGAISLFKDAADGLDLALDGNFPGQGHILADRLACDGRDEAVVMAQPADGPSILPPPTKLMLTS